MKDAIVIRNQGRLHTPKKCLCARLVGTARTCDYRYFFVMVFGFHIIIHRLLIYYAAAAVIIHPYINIILLLLYVILLLLLYIIIFYYY